MNRRYVYLAGPIKGLSYDKATDWRGEITNYLLAEGIVPLSPMRYKQYLRIEEELKGEYPSFPLSSAKGIVTRDRYDVMRCDMVLFNFLGADNVSIGSCVEVGWADAFRKPIVTVLEEGSAHDHAFIRELSGYVVPTLLEARQIVRSVLLSEWNESCIMPADWKR